MSTGPFLKTIVLYFCFPCALAFQTLPQWLNSHLPPRLALPLFSQEQPPQFAL